MSFAEAYRSADAPYRELGADLAVHIPTVRRELKANVKAIAAETAGAAPALRSAMAGCPTSKTPSPRPPLGPFPLPRAHSHRKALPST